MNTFTVHAVSQFGRCGSMEFPSEHQSAVMSWLMASPDQREHVQTALPFLDADHREFLITGMTPDEWAEVLGDEPDE
ncbi:hypothetical protein ACFVUS_12700 [Nocardia sp. NPDC058058]|uniref:hypothetical protein n=1 Tax=Nocardia sp. NPDC058058 TaxID=3346317 RepID=UPI0036DB50A8